MGLLDLGRAPLKYANLLHNRYHSVFLLRIFSCGCFSICFKWIIIVLVTLRNKPFYWVHFYKGELICFHIVKEVPVAIKGLLSNCSLAAICWGYCLLLTVALVLLCDLGKGY